MGTSEVVSPDAARSGLRAAAAAALSRAPEGDATDTSAFDPPAAPEPGLVGEPPGAAMSAGTPPTDTPTGLDIAHGVCRICMLCSACSCRSCCA